MIEGRSGCACIANTFARWPPRPFLDLLLLCRRDTRTLLSTQSQEIKNKWLQKWQSNSDWQPLHAYKAPRIMASTAVWNLEKVWIGLEWLEWLEASEASPYASVSTWKHSLKLLNCFRPHDTKNQEIWPRQWQSSCHFRPRGTWHGITRRHQIHMDGAHQISTPRMLRPHFECLVLASATCTFVFS